MTSDLGQKQYGSFLQYGESIYHEWKVSTIYPSYLEILPFTRILVFTKGHADDTFSIDSHCMVEESIPVDNIRSETYDWSIGYTCSIRQHNLKRWEGGRCTLLLAENS